MDKNRFYRYQDKIMHIEKRISNIFDWKEENHLNDMVKLATYKAFQEVFEGLSDIIAMMVKDLNIKGKDDYSNIEICYEKNIINYKDKSILTEGVGLRNRLVHQYNGLRDELAYEVIYRLCVELGELIRRIQDWLKKSLKD